MTKSLAKAIALATVLGASASAHAINVNQDGLGEVLLYSLYTAEEGNVTNISVTNTTEFAKAVKVRFVEGVNSAEVLDFNLYLSPYDQWSGAVTQTTDGAKLITADKSCTMPAIPKEGKEFVNYEFSGDKADSIGSDGVFQDGLDRTRVGHVEMIEMGVLETAAFVNAVSANHNIAGSAPSNCNLLLEAFESGVWANEAGLNTHFYTDAAGKSGGLYGHASVLNIEGSTQISYDAVAIDNFLRVETSAGVTVAPNHQLTGSVLPSLVSGGNSNATFKNGDQVAFANSAEAVSAVLMKNNISNDFVLDDARGSETNWVVTFPTKRFHVYGSTAGTTPTGLAPFAQEWVVADGEACQTINLKAWDNEEYSPKSQAGIDFSPIKPGKINTRNLCKETNIITFNDAKVLGGEFVYSDISLAQPEYRFGWADIAFTEHVDPVSGAKTTYEMEGTNLDTGAADTITGLPAIGFSAMMIKNNKANNGVMNNYGTAVPHKASTVKDH